MTFRPVRIALGLLLGLPWLCTVAATGCVRGEPPACGRCELRCYKYRPREDGTCYKYQPVCAPAPDCRYWWESTR